MMTRRNLFDWAATGLFTQALRARGQQSPAKQLKPLDTLPGTEKNRKLKVVFVGAHVDDWIFCVGTLARYAREGHDVLCFSFTPGDSQGMADATHMSLEKLAELRRDDAMRGTKLFGSRLKILNQHNQKMRVDPETYDEFNKVLAPENPDIVFALWPLQYHPDHRAGGNLAFNAWLASGMKFDFYFCETWPGPETTPQLFVPDRWVDVESVVDLSRQAILANTLEGKALWADYEICTKFRGRGYGCDYAESFIRIATVASVDPKNLAPRRWFGGGLELSHDR
jgi:LmbE family N-acetylglucosaminyl deacetylase